MRQECFNIGLVMPLAAQQGGAEALLLHLLRHKSERYRYVCAFLEEGPLAEEIRSLSYDVTVIPAARLSNLPDYMKTALAVRSWAKKKDLCAIVSWMPKAHLYVGLATLFQDVRTIWYQHGVSSGNALDRLTTLLPATAVFCCSKTSREAQDRLHPRRATYVSYPGVDFASEGPLSQQEARQTLGLEASQPLVGMVARLEHWKGAHVFVEAASSILQKHPGATLFVVGGPHSLDLNYAEELHRRVRELNLGDNFVLAGQRSMAETTLWQAAADVIVHPVTGIEPFGMSVVEAMAQGKVVVASNAGGPAEVIEDGHSGVLIERSDPVLLAATVDHLLMDKQRRSDIGRNARSRSQIFTTQIFAARFDELVGQALSMGNR